MASGRCARGDGLEPEPLYPLHEHRRCGVIETRNLAVHGERGDMGEAGVGMAGKRPDGG